MKVHLFDLTAGIASLIFAILLYVMRIYTEFYEKKGPGSSKIKDLRLLSLVFSIFSVMCFSMSLEIHIVVLVAGPVMFAIVFMRVRSSFPQFFSGALSSDSERKRPEEHHDQG
jgi:tetrahydromethanopterin S-methyltransferase subunit C